jgi:hypothetical protein
MKSFYRITLLLFAALLPVLTASAQEKRTEKKIKIVVDDGSGEWTVMDTTIKDINISGTLQLKNGKVIVLDEKSSGYAMFSDEDGDEKIYISVKKPGEDDDDKNVIVMSRPGDRKSVSVSVRSDADEDTDATKCVIAKDGIVVTVEGKDEVKVKELMEKIEKEMGIEQKKPSGK